MSKHRPGQVRFEAWIPAPLFDAFTATGTSRTAWLRTALADYLAVQQEPDPPPQPHRHQRTQIGTKIIMGSNVPLYACRECGAELNA
jgi:hypothetical protein